MLVEAPKNLRGRHGGSGITLADPKLDDLEAIVHACNEEIMLARFGGMPFDSPRTAPHIDLHERDKGFSGVEQADGVVIAENGRYDELAPRIVDTYLPTARRCSMNGWL